MYNRRIVITGMGAITALGTSVDQNWQAVLKGESRISPIHNFDTTHYGTKISACIQDFSTDFMPDVRLIKKMDIFIQYAMHAAMEAVKDSKLSFDQLNLKKIGVAIGSGIGGISLIEKSNEGLFQTPVKRISPFFIPGSIVNMAAGYVGMHFKLKGPNFATVSACATSAHNIYLAAQQIRLNLADVMLAGGSEYSITPTSVGGFSACRALSRRNHEPEKASRPWDVGRDGFVIADGAGVLVLEEYEHAKKRNSPIYAELIGCGASCDGYDLTAPHPEGEGAADAIEVALHDAGIKPNQVNYINAHATSTPMGDVIELQAIRHVFGKHIQHMPVSSTKSTTGHLLGASGVVEAIFSVLSLKDQIIPPTMNLDQPDPLCEGFDLVPHLARKAPLKIVLSNSFGFGGSNASLIFKAL